jgi:site-specific DNA-cytosine methylase
MVGLYLMPANNVNRKLSVGDLFSGIGGFSLGLERTGGFETKWFVEIDPFCNKVLEKHWPNVRRYHDIREVHGVNSYSNWDGLQEQSTELQTNRDRQLYETFTDSESGESREQTEPEGGKDTGGGNSQSRDRASCPNCLEPVELICGGFPCQPFSVAGKRKGKEDDRALWPEMFRIIQELKPRWVVGENVAGIINLELENCFSDLEMEGYEVQALVIPACAVQAPHRRDRVWIVAHSESNRDRGCSSNQCGEHRGFVEQNKFEGSSLGSEGEGCFGNAPHSSPECSGRYQRTLPQEGEFMRRGTSWERNWVEVATELCGMDDGIPSTLDETIKEYGYEDRDHQKAITKIDNIRWEILREMWEENGKIKPTSYRTTSREGEDSLCKMSYFRAHDKWKLGERIKTKSDLRDMWARICSLGFSSAQNLLPQMLERVREIERNEKMESQRINRLKSLGNAVVPQIVEIIGRAILEVDESIINPPARTK